jgi:hypothetical protein
MKCRAITSNLSTMIFSLTDLTYALSEALALRERGWGEGLKGYSGSNLF